MNDYKTIKIDQCSSSNIYSSEKIREGVISENSIVITSSQTYGRGRRNNKWESKKGKNITMTINYFPRELNISNSYIFYMISSISIVRVIRSIIDNKIQSYEYSDRDAHDIDHLYNIREDIKIKWPNDIYYKDHKLGGILTQSVLEGSNIKSIICGIGLNVNQTNFETPNAISLSQVLKQEFDLDEIIHQISGNFYSLCNVLFSNHISYNQLHSEYLSSLYYHQQPRFFEVDDDAFMGTIIGVSLEGQLIIQDSDNKLSYHLVDNIKYK